MPTTPLPYAAIATLVAVCMASISAGDSFDFEDVERCAAELAAAPHVPPQKVGRALLDLDYDSYRKIAPRHDTALWRDDNLPTCVEFFPAGFLFEYPVTIHTVADGNVQTIEYGDRWFQFRGDTAPLTKADGGGLAGFRLLSLLPGNAHKTEYMAFLGASYFRGIGSGDWYGTSARGLAIDIGLPRAEEFPRFREFWIERPESSAEDCPQRVWAVLESPGMVGAYEFCLRPGEQTKVSVRARLWQRHGIQKIALAPLTSMFMWNSDSQPLDDPRPEVHDSDGLLIHRNDDEWLWRPLTRPEAPRTTRWGTATLHGFGLMQRNRDPQSYQDDEARYHLRPNVWVETGAHDAWGPGWVELLELPAAHEGIDNIAAYFVIDQTKVDFADSFLIRYELTFGDQPPWDHRTAPVIDSHVSSEKNQITVQFRLPESLTPAKRSRLTPRTTVSSGDVSSITVSHPDEDVAEVTLRLRPTTDEPADVRIWLDSDQEKASEVWSYRWIPESQNLRLVHQ